MRAADLVVPGFRAAGVRCGIKRRGLDLALIASEDPATAAGVFTRSTVVGAPVELSRARVRRGRARVIVANSGVSNVAMGARGRADAREMTAAASPRAAPLGAPPRPAGPPPRPSGAAAPSSKVGRNDPCPCGSGKKYKRCCGA